MLVDYLPIVILMAVAVGFAAVSLLITHLFGPRRPNPVKLSPYESGVPPVGDARLRFSVKFYVVAMLFIVFDIEVVFLYPWAVVFKDLLGPGELYFYGNGGIPRRSCAGTGVCLAEGRSGLGLNADGASEALTIDERAIACLRKRQTEPRWLKSPLKT